MATDERDYEPADPADGDEWYDGFDPERVDDDDDLDGFEVYESEDEYAERIANMTRYADEEDDY